MIPVQIFDRVPRRWDWDNDCADTRSLFSSHLTALGDNTYRYFNQWQNKLVITSWRSLIDGRWGEPVYEYPYSELRSGETASGELINLVGRYYASERWEEAIPF